MKTKHKQLLVKNPYNQQTLAELSFATLTEAQNSLGTAQLAFQKWRTSSAWDRSEILLHAAAQLKKEQEEFAQLICAEAGKPIQLARIEVERAIGVLSWASAEALRFSGELLRLDSNSASRSGFGIHTRFPKGIILGITPYNFPLNLVMHKVAPAIASGCSILIKPSPFTPLTAMRLAQLFEPLVPGLVQVILADDETTALLTQDPQAAHISFTGSAKVGWIIRKQAPEKSTTLELGGNAWVIVMEDTPRELFPAIAQRICGAAYGYAGQSCISVQNAAISSNIWNEFEPHLISATQRTPFGNPQENSVITGPLIHENAATRVKTQIQSIPSDGVSYSSNHEIQSQAGRIAKASLIAPTLIVLPEAQIGTPLPSIVQEEIFAPVMMARKFNEIESIIQQVNSSRYGLQAGVYTQNWPTIERLYRELEVGGLIVNDVPTTRYDHQPYGGVKDSGQGREGVRYAMEEMTDSKFLALSSQIKI
jgi:glyceraldehyde-3-phosphate dehydrogenase (NADP+)